MTIDDAIDHVVRVVDRWRSPEDLEAGGGRIVRRVPWVAPLAWFHKLYPSLSSEVVESIEPLPGRLPPADYKRLLTRFNGMNLFSDSFAVLGVRHHYQRVPELAAWQPYDLTTSQSGEGLTHDDFVVACVGPERDDIVASHASPVVKRVERQTRRELETWQTLADFLVSEVDRYAECYDADGRMLDPLPSQPGKAPPFPKMHIRAIKPRTGSIAWFKTRLGL
jgi:hypothetical protein